MSQDTLVINGILSTVEDSPVSPKPTKNGQKENPTILSPYAKLESGLTKGLSTLIPTIQADSAYKLESGNPQEEKLIQDKIESVKTALLPLVKSGILKQEEVDSKVKEESAKLEKLQTTKKDNMAELLESLSTRLTASLPEGYSISITKKGKRQAGVSTGEHVFYLPKDSDMYDFMLLVQPQKKSYGLIVKITGHEADLEKVGYKANRLPKEYNSQTFALIELGNFEAKTELYEHESSTEAGKVKARRVVADSMKKVGPKVLGKALYTGEHTSMGSLESWALDKLDNSKEHNTNGAQNIAPITQAQLEALAVMFK